MGAPRYRFGDFTLSPTRRVLLRSGREVALIPRYFDLLALLLQRRGEAVHRQQILEAVWSDVVVSDGALSQAVRTIRRALDDNVREPVFIRTVSRHGYRFVYPDVIEEADDALHQDPIATTHASMAAAPAGPAAAMTQDPIEAALGRLLAPPTASDGAASKEEIQREAAESLHSLSTEEALRRLDRRPGHEHARALLRDTRWDVAGAGAVPLLGQPGGLAAAGDLIAMRLRLAARQAGSRWASASAGGFFAGLAAGLLGGIVIRAAPGSAAPANLPVALGLVAAIIGAVGAAGVGAGLAAAESLARSLRGVALVAFGAMGGGGVGAAAHLLGRWTLEDLFGHDLSAVGGGLEGIAIGGAAGLGYALSTPRPGGGGMATPRGWSRLAAAVASGVCCAMAGVALSAAGRNLGGGSLELMARSFQGSHASLAPIANLLGEPEVGPLTRAVLGGYEGLLFGLGTILGLTRRPRAPNDGPG